MDEAPEVATELRVLAIIVEPDGGFRIDADMPEAETLWFLMRAQQLLLADVYAEEEEDNEEGDEEWES